MNTNNSQAPQLPQTDVKSRFFAQYYGQEILRWHQWVKETPDGKVDLSIPAIDKKGWFIKLKPLSKITKNDLEKLKFGNISNKRVTFIFDSYDRHWNSSCGSYGTLLLKDIDYLRSRGYAVPFMEYSVDDLVSFGWVQLV
jgi:hypothetical protein